MGFWEFNSQGKGGWAKNLEFGASTDSQFIKVPLNCPKCTTLQEKPSIQLYNIFPGPNILQEFSIGSPNFPPVGKSGLAVFLTISGLAFTWAGGSPSPCSYPTIVYKVSYDVRSDGKPMVLMPKKHVLDVSGGLVGGIASV